MDYSSIVSSMYDYSISTYCRSDKYLRLYNRINSRISSIKYQYSLGLKLGRTVDPALYISDLRSLSRLLFRLDNNCVIRNTSLRYKRVYQVFNRRFPTKVEDHCMCLFGFYYAKKSNHRRCLDILKKDLDLKKSLGMCTKSVSKNLKDEEFKVNFYESYLNDVKVRCLQARKNELLTRLRLEVLQRVNEGWYLIFDTLTVEPRYEKVVFGKGSTAWSDYIRSFTRYLSIESDGSWRKSLVKQKVEGKNHYYFSVVEEGNVSGKLHIHVLHMVKSLPKGASDPSAGRPHLSYRREISFFKHFWKYGHSHPLPARFNNSDVYAKLGWLWPMSRDKVTGKLSDIKCGSGGAIVGYIGKYLTKSYVPRKEGLAWRVRMTRNLGRKIPQAIVDKANPNQLMLLINGWKMLKMKSQINCLPTKMIQVMALKRLIMLMTSSIQMSMLSLFRELKPKDVIIKSLKSQIWGTVSPIPRTSGHTRVLNIIATVDSSLSDLVCSVERQFLGKVQFHSNVKGLSREYRYVS